MKSAFKLTWAQPTAISTIGVIVDRICATLSFINRLIITGDYRRLSFPLFNKASLLGYTLSILLYSSLSYFFLGPSIFYPPYFSTTNTNIYCRKSNQFDKKSGIFFYIASQTGKLNGAFFSLVSHRSFSLFFSSLLHFLTTFVAGKPVWGLSPQTIHTN